MGSEEVDGPKEAWKKRRSKPMDSMWCRKMRMGHSRPEVMKVRKVRGWWKVHEPQGWRIR